MLEQTNTITSNNYIMEQNDAKFNKEFELSHILGLNSAVNNCVQAHPSMTETISYCIGGIIVTEDLIEKNNQVFFKHGMNQISCFKVSFSGKFLAVGFTTSNLDKSLPASIIVWDYENKKVLFELSGIKKAVAMIEFSPDDRFISALGLDNSFFIWETLTSNRCYHRIFEFSLSLVKWVRIVFEEGSKHSNYSIVVANVNAIFHYYFHFELKSMQYHMQCNKFSLPSSGLVRTFTSAIYDYNTKIVLVGTTGGEICMFNIEKHLFKGSFNAINNGLNNILVFNDSSLIISGGDGKIKKLLYENEKYILSYEIDLLHNVNSLSLSGDRKEVIASTSSGSIFRIMSSDLTFTLHSENHLGAVHQCCFSNNNDNEYFYSVDDFGSLIQWDLNNFSTLSKYLGNGNNKAISVKIGEDGTIFTGYSSGILRNLSPNLEVLWEIPAHRGKINKIYVDGNYILTGGEDGLVRVWTRKSHELCMQFPAHHKEVHALFADRNMPNIVYTGGEDKSMNCFDLKLQKRVIVHSMNNGFIFDMDQKKTEDYEIISIGYNCGLIIWDFFKIDPVVEMNLGANFFALKISNSGKYIALGSETGELWLLMIKEFRLIGKASGHSQRVVSLSWSPDDKQIVSTSIDGSIGVWNIYFN